MKYSTLEYDMNRPSIKVINVPLDSDYGVAVKVFKDGQLIQPNLSVGGYTPTGTRADWQLFELSSGSEPCKKLMEVQAAEVSGSHVGHTWTEHIENQQDTEMEDAIDFEISVVSGEDDITLEASTTKLSAWVAGQQVEEVYAVQYEEESELGWYLDGGTWRTADGSQESESITLAPTDYIRVYYTLSAYQSAEVRVVLESDQTSEGEAVGFKLIVNEEDMSRIETKTTE